jgi:hypothetical protein
MRPAKAAGGLPARASGEPQRIGRLAGLRTLKKRLTVALGQAKNLAALDGMIDPALIVSAQPLNGLALLDPALLAALGGIAIPAAFRLIGGEP